jgi:IS4 transposase
VAATGERKTQILADEVVVAAKKSTAGKYAGTLRRVTAVVEIQGQMKVMMFLTNNLKWSARTAAEIYRDRWGIETFFKELKQTCQIHDFIGYSENAVQWQVWIGLLAHLILRYLRYLSKWGLSFSRLAALVRGTLWNRRKLIETLRLYGTAGPVKSHAAKPRPLYFQAVLDFPSAAMGQQTC